MNQDPFTEGDPTNRKYHLRVKTKFFSKTVNEKVGKEGKHLSYERKMVLLIPEDNDQRTSFLAAWLPDTTGEHYEIPAVIAYPVDSPCRVSIHRGPDEKHDRHYLFVMSKGVEDILVKLKEGTTLNLQTLPAHDEDETDHSVDSNGNYEVV